MTSIFTNTSSSGEEQLAFLNQAGEKFIISDSSNPILRLEKTSDQTLTGADTYNDVEWHIGIQDTAGMWDAGNPEVITVKKSGRYYVSFQLCLEQINNTTFTAQALCDGSPSSKSITIDSGVNNAVDLQGTNIVELTKDEVYKIQWKASKVSDLLASETKLDVIMINPT